MLVMTDGSARLEFDVVDGTLRLAGEIDAHTAPELAQRLSDSTWNGEWLVDVSGVEFMDSSGLRVLIDAHQRAESAGTRLVLVAPGRAVARIIEVSGLSDHLNVVPAGA